MEVLEKYLLDGNEKKAGLNLKKYLKRYKVQDFFTGFFGCAFEKNGDEPKYAAGKLSCHFITEKIILKQEYLEELSALVVPCLEDYETDMPLVWEHLAKISFPLCSKEIFSLPDLAPCFTAVKGSTGSARFLKCLLNLLMEEKGKFWLQQKWIVWNISTWGGNLSLMNDFVRANELKTFVIENKLEFLCNAKVLCMETATCEIRRMICAKESFNAIRLWINDNVGQERIMIEDYIAAISDNLSMTTRLINGDQNDAEPAKNDTAEMHNKNCGALSSEDEIESSAVENESALANAWNTRAENVWIPARLRRKYPTAGVRTTQKTPKKKLNGNREISEDEIKSSVVENETTSASARRYRAEEVWRPSCLRRKNTTAAVSTTQSQKSPDKKGQNKRLVVIDHGNMTEEEVKKDALFRRVRNILNRLTPGTFQKLVKQMKSLPIDNGSQLCGVIDLIYKKAVDEPGLSATIARFCKIFPEVALPFGNYKEDGIPNIVTFKKLLIDKCQHEFEKDASDELKRDERFKEINAETDLEKTKSLLSSFREEKRRIRMKKLGNVRLIGELYKLDMLTARVIHSCIESLINSQGNESFECLCVLLTTAGPVLERTINEEKRQAAFGFEDLQYMKQNAEDKDDRDAGNIINLTGRRRQDARSRYIDFNQWFKRLEVIVKDKNSRSNRISNRVRFMIQNLLDLRNNDWIPPSHDSEIHTISKDQKEGEILEMNLASSSSKGGKRGTENPTLENEQSSVDSEGWTTVTSASTKSRKITKVEKIQRKESNFLRGVGKAILKQPNGVHMNG